MNPHHQRTPNSNLVPRSSEITPLTAGHQFSPQHVPPHNVQNSPHSQQSSQAGQHSHYASLQSSQSPGHYNTLNQPLFHPPSPDVFTPTPITPFEHHRARLQSTPHPTGRSTRDQVVFLPILSSNSSSSSSHQSLNPHLNTRRASHINRSDSSCSYASTPGAPIPHQVLRQRVAPLHPSPLSSSTIQSSTCQPSTLTTPPSRVNQPRPGNQDLTSTSSPVPPPPLAGLHDRISKKRKCSEISEDGGPEAQSEEELLKLTEAQLAIQARKASKRAMSDDDRDFFANFHHRQRKLLIIQAIERGVSMPMVDGYLGKRMVIKKPSGWNRFMQTPKVREVFRGAQKGVKDKSAMPLVSTMWNELPEEERLRYMKPSSKKQHNNLDPSIAATNNENPSGEADDDNEDELQVIMRRSVSFKRASDQVQDFMADWFEQAVHISKTCDCEMVMFAVSRHLGTHSFQFTRSTHGATRFVMGAQILDGTRHYAAQFQSYITGYEVAQIAKINGKKQGPPKTPSVSTAVRLSHLITEKTEGVIKKWPWTRTEFRLAKLKYRLVLLPGSKTNRDWLMRPGRELKGPREATLHLDLDKKLIDVVHDPSIPDDVTEADYSSSIVSSDSNTGSSTQSNWPQDKQLSNSCHTSLDENDTAVSDQLSHQVNYDGFESDVSHRSIEESEDEESDYEESDDPFLCDISLGIQGNTPNFLSEALCTPYNLE
ncbi:hypothetical protein PGTUg99_027643 [Puccinia graminis f. sp. tritici]|uniref:Uncharacterized protein n=1 Tax=Puccinia graminis f. sp. tritici TaxID=56615 RepID=A0A5B0PJ12_PUCGR|nr:hypothetical protein PGTUg99_027643 [Puccinia graminis f. sp. tritici]